MRRECVQAAGVWLCGLVAAQDSVVCCQDVPCCLDQAHRTTTRCTRIGATSPPAATDTVTVRCGPSVPAAIAYTPADPLQVQRVLLQLLLLLLVLWLRRLMPLSTTPSPSIIFCAASWSGQRTMFDSTSSIVKEAMLTLLPTSITSLTYASTCSSNQRQPRAQQGQHSDLRRELARQVKRTTVNNPADSLVQQPSCITDKNKLRLVMMIRDLHHACACGAMLLLLLPQPANCCRQATNSYVLAGTCRAPSVLPRTSPLCR